MNTIQTWIADAAAWVTDNSTDVIYIALAVVAVSLLTGQGGGRR